MTLLILGLVLWSGVHLYPAVFCAHRDGLIEQHGEKPYKIVFGVFIILSVILMILGWQSFEDIPVLYNIYDFTIVPALIFMLIAFILIASSVIENNLGNAVRHPQLIGVAIWAFSHLLINGDLRATVLFGGLLLWALVSIVLINKRDGVYEKPKFLLPHKTITAGAAGLVLFIAFVWGHEYISGVNLMGPAVS